MLPSPSFSSAKAEAAGYPDSNAFSVLNSHPLELLRRGGFTTWVHGAFLKREMMKNLLVKRGNIRVLPEQPGDEREARTRRDLNTSLKPDNSERGRNPLPPATSRAKTKM